MVLGEAQPAAALRRPPRSTAWVLLLASAAAVGVTGLVATGLALWQLPASQVSLAPGYIAALVAGSVLTVASLGLRALRWVFLLRRAETRIPIEDAYIGYFAGFSLLLAPLLLGEVFVRAVVLKKRGRVPPAVTAIVNLWERVLDVAALAVIAGVAGLLSGTGQTILLVAAAAVTVLRPLRRAILGLAARLARPLGPWEQGRSLDRLAASRTWLVGLATSLAAWVLPGLALLLIVGSFERGDKMGWVAAEQAYASASLRGGLVLAPGGVVVAGGELMAAITGVGLPEAAALLAVFGIRLATVGVSTLLGLVFVLIHARTSSAAASHFDAIADAYDVQIPEARRLSLLTTKTEMMRDVIRRRGLGPRGLDVGCGQGTYVARMRELGFDVSGIDASEGQVRMAGRHVGQAGVVVEGSALQIPAEDASLDFVYTINVLHHLASVAEQRRAFAEIVRVLKPGGAVFVHEINTRNILFRFYMGYVFPSLNCIDEGIERWLLPHRLADYTTDLTTVEVRYFTFLPDFLPSPIVRAMAPLERWLEGSSLAPYSAHYMAVLQKPS